MSTSSLARFWCDATRHKAAIKAIAARPPIIDLDSLRRLHKATKEAQAKRVFLLITGECAEPLAMQEAALDRHISLNAVLAESIAHHLQRPVLRLLRLAGQFAKPRSSIVEERNGVFLPAYAGDIMNGFAFARAQRQIDPSRLAVCHDVAQHRHTRIRTHPQGGQDVFTMREALFLPFEEALSYQAAQHGKEAQPADKVEKNLFNGIAHCLWVGMRCAYLQSPHVAYISQLLNPVGVKCGPLLRPEDFLRIYRRINPANMPGKILLIARFGAAKAAECTAAFKKILQAHGLCPLWIADPMHGNTHLATDGGKIRYLPQMAAEMAAMQAVLDAKPALSLDGMMLETAPQALQECHDGPLNAPIPPQRRYTSLCDPRLSPQQAQRFVNLVFH